jgi:hypothetical protein
MFYYWVVFIYSAFRIPHSAFPNGGLMPGDQTTVPASPANPSPRSRGAQAGNHNAIKHGFYARAYHLKENHDLENAQFKGLAQEIQLMRVYIRRMLAVDTTHFTTSESLTLFRTFALAMHSLTRLVRTEKLIEDPQDKIGEALIEAATACRAEMEARAAGDFSSPPYVLPDISRRR